MNPSLIFYNALLVPLMWILFRLGGLFNKKIRLGINGRKYSSGELRSSLNQLKGSKRLWFHASSLGEFEQAKPIIAEIKTLHPHIDIVATFFSPSGFENSKHYPLVDVISYIPFDSYFGVRRFLDTVQPQVAIMVRYDIWPNMIYALKEKNIPIVIANATMRSDSVRKAMLLKSFHRNLYDCFHLILTVSDADALSFREFNTSKPVIKAIGDTRFDQVLKRSNDARQRIILSENVTSGKKIFIVGQSWAEDDDIVIPALLKLQHYDRDVLTLIVPHEPTIEHLEALESKLEGRCQTIRFSELNIFNNEPIILVDSIGVLVALYQYADVVYVGGSFRQGVHNILEPAIFGLPVLYGPKHTNSQEAVELIRRGGGFVVRDSKALFRMLRKLFSDSTARSAAGAVSESFVREHSGATKRFLQFLQPYLN